MSTNAEGVFVIAAATLVLFSALVVPEISMLAWIGLIAASLRTGQAPAGLDSYTTLVIQALDLGVIVPACVITAVLLWRRRPWGYTLASVVLVKILTMGAALIAMIISMMLAGVTVDPVQSILFVVICVSGITLGSIEEEKSVQPGRARLRTS